LHQRPAKNKREEEEREGKLGFKLVERGKKKEGGKITECRRGGAEGPNTQRGNLSLKDRARGGGTKNRGRDL